MNKVKGLTHYRFLRISRNLERPEVILLMGVSGFDHYASKI